MKSRSKDLLDRAIAATVAAIEIYNKPDFKYREEAFTVLATNGWELALKAKWLADNNNRPSSLYVFEARKKLDGTPSKKLRTKLTRCGNPFTHSLDYLAKQLVNQKKLDEKAWKNLEALMEMRDSAIHFYNRSPGFARKLQEVGSACLKNFVALISDWFGQNLSGFNFYLMPLSFVSPPSEVSAVVLNNEEKNFLKFVDDLNGSGGDPNERYSVTVNIEVKFTRTQSKDAIPVIVTTDASATKIQLTDEQIRQKYPWDYDRLTTECRKRFSDFKADAKYHDLRKGFLADTRLGAIRYLDPGNPKSSKKPFFSPNIIGEFDKHYTKFKPTKVSK